MKEIFIGYNTAIKTSSFICISYASFMANHASNMKSKTDKPIRKSRVRTPVTVIVEHEFVGDKTISEALIPVIFEELRRKAEKIRTLDKHFELS